MSAPFRASLALAYADAQNLLTNQTQFPVPARPQGQSDFAYNQTLESILLDLRDVETDVHDPLPVSDASYPTALDLLRKSYDNPEDVARSLHNSLRNLPRVRGGDNFCPDLRSLTEQLECICVQMDQQGHSFNPTSFQMEIEERLPRFVLDELFKLKEEDDDWTPDKLKDYLRTQLKLPKANTRIPIIFNQIYHFTSPH
ncbi:hypothetical protein niasHT_028350 [Heterodera trifolii]|uniref:Uncharacterized protein n=1 Tax=Heterodera trifolii TaxID=157864 RepID=A0ABD2KSN6_9BILA